MRSLPTKLLFFSIVSLAFQLPFLNAQEENAVTAIKGQVVLPGKVADGINIEGLSLKGAEIVLEGQYNHPRKPYPANWREMKSAEKREWVNEFDKSEQHAVYQEKVKAALEKRFRKKTVIGENGEFSFEGIKPAWYQISMKVLPPNAPEPRDDQDFSNCRAYMLKQFFVRDLSKPLVFNKIVAKVQNLVLPGDMAPDFTMSDYEGGTFKLSDLRGKYVLFDCWATWCEPCLAQIPYLEAISEKHGGENFIIVGINTDKKIDKAKAFLKVNSSHYKQSYAGTEELYEPMSVGYGIKSIPAIWLIDPEGKVVAKNLMGADIQKEVEKALKAVKK